MEVGPQLCMPMARLELKGRTQNKRIFSFSHKRTTCSLLQCNLYFLPARRLGRLRRLGRPISYHWRGTLRFPGGDGSAAVGAFRGDATRKRTQKKDRSN